MCWQKNWIVNVSKTAQRGSDREMMKQFRKENDMDHSKEMVKLAYAALDEKKGEDIQIIDIQGVSVLADYFIIANGNNSNQVQAMADQVQEDLAKAGYECKQVEGYQSANWILMDYKDIIVHVFCREDRLFYDLERIWRDGKTIVDVNEL